MWYELKIQIYKKGIEKIVKVIKRKGKGEEMKHFNSYLEVFYPNG